MWQEQDGDRSDLDMAHWLHEQLMNNTCPGLEMISNTERKFRIPWCNGKSGGLKPGGDDTNFIIAWARHKKYKGKTDNDKDLSTWKGNFRNALNKCSNIKRLGTKKNKYIVCSFTEDFSVNFNYTGVGSQNRKRASCQCSSNNNTLSMEDSPPSKKFNYVIPGFDLKEYIMTVERNSNQVSVPSSSPNNTTGSPQWAPYDAKFNSIQVEIVYGRREKRTVTCEMLEKTDTLYRIASFQMATLKELLSEEGEICIQLPRLEDLMHFKFSGDERKKMSEILPDMARGIILKHDGRDIYLQRRSLVRVYLTDGKYPATPVSRSKTKQEFVKAFDMSLFKNKLNSYVEKKSMRRPRPGFILTVGHDIDEKEENPLESCYVYIEVTHLWAKKMATESTNVFRIPKIPLCSNPDCLDILITLTQQGADPVPAIPTSDLTGYVFPEITSLQQELSSPYRTLNIEEKSVMAVEINSPLFDPHRTLVGESVSRCRIFYGVAETQMREDNFKEDNSLELKLPDVTFNFSNVSEEVRLEVDKFMKDMNRGVHLIWNERSIFAERRTVLRVFHCEANSPTVKLKRKTMSEKPDPMKIFDFTKFENELSQYKNGGPLPKPYTLLTIGNESTLGAQNISEDVYLYIKVTHLLAEHILQGISNASIKHSSTKYSLLDSMDETVRCINELTLGH